MEPTGDPTVALKPWLDLLVSYGWPSIISAMVVWLLWKLIPFIPEWVKSSIDSQKQVPLELSKMNHNMEDMISIVVTDNEQLKKSFRYTANAARKKLEGKSDMDVISDLEKATESLNLRNP